MCEVVVSTGARLHFGLFGMNSELPLQFGGLGMMVETPGVTVVARPATELQVTAPSDVTRRVEMFARRAISHMPQLPPAALHVTRHIPSHRGLGSGTQLALAAVAAMCELSGVQASATELAAAAGRGERSAIGIHGFRRGGFLLDHGHAPGRFSQEIAARAAVPADWRVVLVCPNDVEGLSGPPEREAFSRLGPMSVAETQALHRHAETQVLPALERADFEAFAMSLHEFGERVGRFFAPVQGGTYASQMAAVLVEQLRREGLPAAVQSSWGPTVCIPAASDQAAADVAARVPPSFRTSIVAPRNTGAAICVRDVKAGRSSAVSDNIG